jgi:hypothetical protein
MEKTLETFFSLALIKDATKWWKLLNHDMLKLPYGEQENIFLDKWSHAMNNGKEITKGLC